MRGWKSSALKTRKANMQRNETEPFLQGYLDAALFTTDEHPPSGADYVTSGRASEMFPALPDWFIEQARKDCAKFAEANAELLRQAGDMNQNGVDFWFTRNHHGAGYWDRGYPDEVAQPLTKAAHKFGECDLCRSDIGQPAKEASHV